MYHINYVAREAIDIAKWDRCIDEAKNGLIYAYSIYLDNMATHWDALVLNDYEAVMPLTWNKKWGIKYLYQPPFTQQLGIFGRRIINEQDIRSFITIAKEKFPFAEIFLNALNPYVETEKKNNYILNLNDGYEKIHASYKKNLLQNLKDSKKNNLVYSIGMDYKQAIDFYVSRYSNRMPHTTRKDYQRFFKVCDLLNEKKMLFIRKVSLPNNELLAIALFFKDNKRLYNIMPTTLLKGRGLKANHFLIDELIIEFAGKNIILDFEGSDIAGIARFYQQFGSSNEPYYFLRYNNLPWFARLFKK